MGPKTKGIPAFSHVTIFLLSSCSFSMCLCNPFFALVLCTFSRRVRSQAHCLRRSTLNSKHVPREQALFQLQSLPQGLHSRFAGQTADLLRSAALTAEALAIFGTYLRVHDSAAFELPAIAVDALAASLRASLGHNGRGPGGSAAACSALLGSLHVLRNIAGNHVEAARCISSRDLATGGRRVHM